MTPRPRTTAIALLGVLLLGVVGLLPVVGVTAAQAATASVAGTVTGETADGGTEPVAGGEVDPDPIPTPVTNTAVPTISGVAKVGSRLTATAGTWTPTSVTPTYQWLVAGAPVAGGTTSTYTPQPADVGKTVQVRVTATAARHTTASATSVTTSPVARGTLVNTGRPKVSGTAKVGKTLTANPGTWLPAAKVT